jgi:hypothetical protein
VIPWLLGVNCLHTAACTIILLINVDSYILACYLLYLSILFQTRGCIYPKWVHHHSFCCSVLSLCKPLIENGEEEGMWIHLLLRCLLFICSMWGRAGLVYNVTEYLFSHGINIENLETHTEQVLTSLDSQCFWCDCGA